MHIVSVGHRCFHWQYLTFLQDTIQSDDRNMAPVARIEPSTFLLHSYHFLTNDSWLLDWEQNRKVLEEKREYHKNKSIPHLTSEDNTKCAK